MLTEPPFIAPQRFHDASEALAQVQRIYGQSIAHLRDAMRRFVAGDDTLGHVRAFYPLVRVKTDTVSRQGSAEGAGLSYGFVAGPGRFETTITRPDLFQDYFREQFALLLHNHGVALEVCTSTQAIPVHFSFADNDHIEGSMDASRRARMRDVFDLPDLAAMDDGIANGTFEPRAGEPQPLSLFTAPRVDYSLHRLRHYTGTLPEQFQNFVLFTNYQFYIDEFIALGRAAMADPASDYVAFVEPGNVTTWRTSASGVPPMARRIWPNPLPSGSAKAREYINPKSSASCSDTPPALVAASVIASTSPRLSQDRAINALAPALGNTRGLGDCARNASCVASIK